MAKTSSGIENMHTLYFQFNGVLIICFQRINPFLRTYLTLKLYFYMAYPLSRGCSSNSEGCANLCLTFMFAGPSVFCFPSFCLVVCVCRRIRNSPLAKQQDK